MSEKFGLDWRQHDAVRMYYFLNIIEAEAERDKANQKENKSYGR